MAYLTELLAQSKPPLAGAGVVPPGMAYSSYYPAWETQTPQYQAPSVYGTIQTGFMQNEFAYSVMITRSIAKSQAPLLVYDNRGEHPEELTDHPLRKLIEHPNENLDETMFWQIKQIIQDIAGFCAWEIERNNVGDPIRLWLMRPDWCSFIRGQQKPLAYVRYQPYGLEPVDIPIENILFFTDGEDFHPLYPQVKFFSPLMHALPQLRIDNAMTFFLNDFVEHGARPGGIVSVTNTITDQIAEDYRKRWVERYGGSSNWSVPLFLGLGSTYTPTQMNFKDMAFPELDARAELRICRAFNIDPIVVDAKAGLDISSYNNKEQAEKGWFQKWVKPSWRSDAGTVDAQLIDEFEGDAADEFYTEFDTRDVYSLVEDRNKKVDRAVALYKTKIARLNEAREEVDLDPIDGEEGEAFYQDTKPEPPKTDENGNPIEPKLDAAGNPIPPEPGDEPTAEPPMTPERIAAMADEEKKFRRFAKKRIAEGKMGDVMEYEFKFISPDRAQLLMNAALADPVKNALDTLLGGR